jgi:hypothetical protein
MTQINKEWIPEQVENDKMKETTENTDDEKGHSIAVPLQGVVIFSE